MRIFLFGCRLGGWSVVRLVRFCCTMRLIAEGVLLEHDALPPVLPIVIYNGRWSWTAGPRRRMCPS